MTIREACEVLTVEDSSSFFQEWHNLSQEVARQIQAIVEVWKNKAKQ